jgi:hypothetical protein
MTGEAEYVIATINSEIFLDTERARPSELPLAPNRQLTGMQSVTRTPLDRTPLDK